MGILEGGTEENIEQYKKSREGGNPFKNAYRNMFRVDTVDMVAEQSGIHGQIVHMDFKNDVVVVKLSSNSNSTRMFGLENYGLYQTSYIAPSKKSSKKGSKVKKGKGSKVAKSRY